MEYNDQDLNRTQPDAQEQPEQTYESAPEENLEQEQASPEAQPAQDTVWQSPGYYGQQPESAPEAPQAQETPAENPGSAYTSSPYGYPNHDTPPQTGNPQANPYANPNPYGQPYYAHQAQGPQNAAPANDPWVYRSGNGVPPAYEGSRKANRPRRVWPAVVVTAICCLLVGALAGALVLPLFGVDLSSGREVTTQTPHDNIVQPLPDSAQDQPGAGQDPDFTFEEGDDRLSYVASGGLADMAEAVTPSIVGVLNLTYQTQNNFYGYGFGYGGSQQGNSEPYLEETGSGSGVIISQDGYIVTNAHVVDGADALKILMNDGEEVDAVLVGTDTVTDLAVVKVDRTGLDAANLGDSDLVRVGEMAVAIGNPLGSELAGTVTMGIISAVDRTIEVDNQYIDVLQTDAAINPGNSGGALVNQAGQVIGITSAKTVVAGYDASGNAISAEGIGYAIPINNAKPIIEQLIQTGTVPRPALGVSVQLVTNMIDSDQKGLLVTDVTKGGSADAAGIQVNDVITHMDGVNFESLSDFKQELMKHQVGDVITLKISRNEENIEVQVTLMDAKALETDTGEQESQDNSQWVVPGYGGFDGYGFNPFG